MNLSMIAYLVGCVMEIEAGLMMLPVLVGLYYGERTALSFVIVAAVEAVLGIVLGLHRRGLDHSNCNRGGMATPARKFGSMDPSLGLRAPQPGKIVAPSWRQQH